MVSTNKIYSFLLLWVLLYASSCKSKPGSSDGNPLSNIFSSNTEISADQIQAALNARFGSAAQEDDTSKAICKIKNVPSSVKQAYERNNHQSFWIDGEGVSKQGQDLLTALDSLKYDGLNGDRYQLDRLKAQVGQGKKISSDSLAAIDVAMTANYLQAATDLVFGAVDPAKVDSQWHAANDSSFAGLDRLMEVRNGGSVDFQAFRPNNPRYALMRIAMMQWEKLATDSSYLQAKNQVAAGSDSLIHFVMQKEMGDQNVEDSVFIKTYQYVNGLSQSGKVDEETKTVLAHTTEKRMTQLALNLERLRWLPQKLEQDYIWVSIPQAEVDFFKDGTNVFHNRTIVGAKSTQTPTIMKPLHNIVVNPPWTLPFSIIEKELKGRIPRMYEVIGAGGKKLPNSVVNIKNFKRYTVRQPAGPKAALGYVKFNLPNKWDIYLHDTPGRYAFGNKKRYLSHGCVRVKDPRTLAALILEEKNIGLDSLNNLIAKGKTKEIITPKIPVYITYTTVNADSSLKQLMFLSDPYKKDSALIAQMFQK